MGLIWIIISVLIGAFIGWTTPQPVWAKTAQEKVTKWWNDLNSKK